MSKRSYSMNLAVGADLGQHGEMNGPTLFRQIARIGRRRGASWVRILDWAKLLATGEGRSRLWTGFRFRKQLHQGSCYTEQDRYPDLFRLAQSLAPNARRVLSFGCSTGEELISLRAWFPKAAIIGAEINPRSRRLAARRVRNDPHAHVVGPERLEGHFEVIFALSVFQRDPHRVIEFGIKHLSTIYPFEKFDAELSRLTQRLADGGVLCVFNAQYRVEDSAVASLLRPVTGAPQMTPPLFDCDGQLLTNPVATSIFERSYTGRRIA